MVSDTQGYNCSGGCEGKSIQRPNMATHCETVMIGSVRGPTAVESVPVMNGNSAAPVNPNPPIQPMDPVRSHGGIRRPDSFIRMGYMGPKKNPTKETAIASPTREGTSQTTNSSLR